MRLVLSLLSLSLLSGPLPAQHSHETRPRQTAILEQGLGSYHRPVSTKSAEAQKFFDQGLTFLYAFNHDAAIRAFERAAELDPNLAMAHWGIAYALGPNINMDIDAEREKTAWQHVRRAQSLSANASELERAYIDALTERYSGDEKPDRARLNVAYKNAMSGLMKLYPDDLDAATLYAEALMDLRPWKLWKKDGTPEPGTEEIVRVLESVLRRDPTHIGANHFYIHAVEASPTPERALASAERLKELVPNAGHLVHMPAHIFMRTGDYRQATEANAKGVEVDRAYIARYGDSGMYPMLYYNHNLHFLASAAAMEGRFTETMAAANEVSRNAAPMAKDMAMIQGVSQWPLFMLVRFHRWNDILATPRPDAGPQAAAVWHFARGMAYAAARRPESKQEMQKLREALRGVSENDAFMLNLGRDVLAVGDRVLAGGIAASVGNDEEAVRLLREAAQLEDKLAYDEPADWPNPVREVLGGLLLHRGRFDEAESVFREELELNPRSGRALFGLMKSLEGQKKTAAAESVRGQYERAWSRADAPLRVEDL